MANIEVNVYLTGGGKATVKLEGVAQSAAALDVTLKNLLTQSGDIFRFTSPKSFIQLKKSEIIGFSVDEF